ncbi:MAG TPA: hypothetical protein VM658_02640 [bacterium]|nr:hypothetical protein [bacterium]
MRALWDGAAGMLMAALIAMPLWMVKAGVIAMFVALALWALSMPRQYAYRGAVDQARWRDVRIWAVIVIALEIIPYLFF